MRTGKLDRRITIQTRATSIDAYGQNTGVWSTHKSVWANAFQDDGRESVEDNNRQTTRKVKFRVRWDDTLTVEMRVIWKGDYYNIGDIKELGREDGLLLITTLLTQT